MTVKGAVIGLALIVAIVMAAMVGAVAGYLARHDGGSVPTALTRGAAAFAATLLLIAAVAGAVVAVNGH